MGLQRDNPSSSKSKQHVKVYHMEDDGKWGERGTRHVTVDCLEKSEDLGLFVIGEEDDCTLLVHHISSDEMHHRQEDAVISWSDPEFSAELAVSFQEITGCSYIWDHICTVQRNLHFSGLDNLESDPCSVSEMPETTRSLQEDAEAFHNVDNCLSELPSVELSTLPLILQTVVESGVTNRMRVVELILKDQNFLRKLVDLFRICEELNKVDSLHMICKLVKGIILLKSPLIFEKMFGDEFIMDFIGSLEYDPEVPQVQQLRAFLKEHVVFKEAIPVKDPITLSKIRRSYRYVFVKKVILPRVLDEATIANLNYIDSHIHSSPVVNDGAFVQQLFARIRSPATPIESKRNLALFLQELCCLSKSIPPHQQLQLFQDLVNEGIFHIITDALHSRDDRLVLTWTNILILFLNKDPNLLREFIIQREGNSLLGLLVCRSQNRSPSNFAILQLRLEVAKMVEGMITGFGEDMHDQFLEILCILLDSRTLSGQQGNKIIEIFYKKYLGWLVDVITTSCPPKGIAETLRKSTCSGGGVEAQIDVKPGTLKNICEFLSFCVLHHPYRINCNLLTSSVIEKVLLLTRRREKYLVVAAVRFLRTIIAKNDEHALNYIIKNNILKPVLEAFFENGNRYNLLYSAVLELLEYVCKENLKMLISCIVDSFWDQLAKFEYLPTIHALKVIYDQSLENCETKSTVEMVEIRKQMDHPSLEKEVDYFNDDRLGSAGPADYEDDVDEEYSPPMKKQETSIIDDETVSTKLKRKSTSGSSSSSKGLEPSQLIKKHRLDKVSDDDSVSGAAACSSCIHMDSPNNKAVVPTSQKTDDSCSRHEPYGNKDCIPPQGSLNSTTNAVDTRDPIREDCAEAPTSDYTSDLTINDASAEG